MKLLLLGANSLLGRSLVRVLQQYELDFHAVEAHELDLLSKKDIIQALNIPGITQVINVGSYANLEKAETDDEASALCDRINSEGVSMLAEVCQSLELPLLHHSTAMVFDGQKTHPYDEDDTTNPVSRYGMSKWYGERAIREILPQHIILRTDWLFSREQTRYFEEHIANCIRQQGKLELIHHRFSPTPAPDAARVLLAIARQVDCGAEVWGTYHYCSLQPMSQEVFVEGFLQMAANYDPKLAAVIDKLAITSLPATLPYIDNTVLASNRIFETFGIKQRSRMGELNGVLQDIYKLEALPQEPAPFTPDKGDIADRDEDKQEPPKVRKRPKAARPAKTGAKRKASRSA